MDTKTLEKLQRIYNQADSFGKELIEKEFPELKESEDEKNIENLIDELKDSLRAANCQNDATGGGHEKRIALLEWGIAWLEKQSEKEETCQDITSLGRCYMEGEQKEHLELKAGH